MERRVQHQDPRQAERLVKNYIEDMISKGFVLKKVSPNFREGVYTYSVFMVAAHSAT